MAICVLVFEVLLFCRYIAVVGHGWDCQVTVTYASVGIAVSVTQNNVRLRINIGEIKCA